MPYLLFLKKQQNLKIVVCCKLLVALYGLTLSLLAATFRSQPLVLKRSREYKVSVF